MCGIAGYIGTSPLAEGDIRAALGSMNRRGPDAQRYWNADTGSQFVSLLHARLSIIDLDERSHQPFAAGGCVLVFNGEIYNYLELREELVRRGVDLLTQSDTEVLLHYYLIFGERCVEHFEGMWAFAIWDPRDEKLFLSRDRFAEKPLYYYSDTQGFYFASEVKTLESLLGRRFNVNESHLLRYVIQGHKSLYRSNHGFFEDVFEIPFASNCTIRSDFRPQLSEYWRPVYQPVESMTERDAIEGTRHHLIESLRIRLRSDVPLAFCLSGGVDSASLVSIASHLFKAEVNTFSIIDSDARYDESDNIQATIDDTGCRSTTILLSPGEQNIARLEDLVRYHDAPVATISYFVHSMLSEAIASNGYRISLSGTGADELFTGYYDHFLMHLYEIKDRPNFEMARAEWESHVLPFVRHPEFRKWDLFISDPTRRDQIFLNQDEFRSLLIRDFHEEFSETTYTSSLLRNRMLNELFHEVVRVILHEDDLNSMRYSIENRSPFLDKNLAEFAYSIPSHLLVNKGYNKYILREAVKGILNDQVRLSREKKGFNASINSIFDFSDPRHRDYFLSDSEIFRWFDRDKIAALLNRSDFPNSYKKFLFSFICAKIFLDQRRIMT